MGSALEVGDRFVFRRTFTDGDVSLFCGVTGDYNPFHIDDAFAAASRFGRRIVPGLLTASTVTHIGGLLGFLASEMRFSFVGPVYVGDTVTCVATIVGVGERGVVDATVEITNERGEVIVTGAFSGKPTQVRLLPEEKESR
jgi:3-hydroxybutyryl-CoA dehydratase